MSRVETELIGGGLDGRRIWLSTKHSYVWVDSAVGGKVYPAPGPGRCLYKLDDATSTYVYAGNTWAMCPGCGAYVDRIDGHNHQCSLCGSSLSTG